MQHEQPKAYAKRKRKSAAQLPDTDGMYSSPYSPSSPPTTTTTTTARERRMSIPTVSSLHVSPSASPNKSSSSITVPPLNGGEQQHLVDESQTSAPHLAIVIAPSSSIVNHDESEHQHLLQLRDYVTVTRLLDEAAATHNPKDLISQAISGLEELIFSMGDDVPHLHFLLAQALSRRIPFFASYSSLTEDQKENIPCIIREYQRITELCPKHPTAKLQYEYWKSFQEGREEDMRKWKDRIEDPHLEYPRDGPYSISEAQAALKVLQYRNTHRYYTDDLKNNEEQQQHRKSQSFERIQHMKTRKKRGGRSNNNEEEEEEEEEKEEEEEEDEEDEDFDAESEMNGMQEEEEGGRRATKRKRKVTSWMKDKDIYIDFKPKTRVKKRATTTTTKRSKAQSAAAPAETTANTNTTRRPGRGRPKKEGTKEAKAAATKKSNRTPDRGRGRPKKEGTKEEKPASKTRKRKRKEEEEKEEGEEGEKKKLEKLQLPPLEKKKKQEERVVKGEEKEEEETLSKKKEPNRPISARRLTPPPARPVRKVTPVKPRRRVIKKEKPQQTEKKDKQPARKKQRVNRITNGKTEENSQAIERKPEQQQQKIIEEPEMREELDEIVEQVTARVEGKMQDIVRMANIHIKLAREIVSLLKQQVEEQEAEEEEQREVDEEGLVTRTVTVKLKLVT